MENTTNTTNTADSIYAEIFRGLEYHANNPAYELLEIIHELHSVGFTSIREILGILFNNESDNAYIYYLIGNNNIDELREIANR